MSDIICTQIHEPELSVGVGRTESSLGLGFKVLSD